MIRILLLLSLSASLALASPVVSGEVLCQVCSEAVKDVEAAVLDDKMHARLVGRLETVCEMVGAERREECDSVLNGLTREVLHHLMQDMDPIDLCMALTACPAHTDIRVQNRPTVVRRVGEDNTTCEMCELLVQIIDEMIRNKTSPAAANATAHKLCELMPPQLKDTCFTFIPLIIDMFIYGVDPVGACTNIGVCLNEPKKFEAQVKLDMKQVEDGDTKCKLCEFLVQTIDDLIRNKTTPEAANVTAHELCEILPQQLRQTCITFIPLIIDMIIQGVDPVGACTNLGICLNAPEPVLQYIPPQQVHEPQDGLTCEMCELLVLALDQYLADNNTEAGINATVYKLCDDLPAGTLKDACLQVAPQVVSALSKGVDPKQACTALKLCSSTGHKMFEREVHIKLPSDSPACELCELLVQTVDQYLKDNKTEAAINATVYKLCNDLPAGTLQSTCLQYAPQVVSALSKGVDPKQACTFLQLCAFADNKIFERQADLKLPSDTPMCELCELLVQTVDQYLKNNKTEAAINATVYKLCNDLPAGALQDACLQFAPDVVSILSKGVDPKQACTVIGLCSSKDNGISERQIDFKLPSDSPACELCELLVQTVDQYLKDNKTEAAINATVYKLCNDLPAGTLQSTCLQYAPQVVSALSKGVDPKQACTFLQLCASAGSKIFERQIDLKLLSDSPACELCELLVQTVDQYLKDNKTEAAINATIYKLCSDLPAGTLQNTCLQFAPDVVSILSKGVDPKQACTAIGLCSSKDNSISEGQIDFKLPSDTPVCELCELLVQTVDQYLKDNKTEAAINATVYKLCNDLPAGTLQSTCLQFAPDVVSILSKGVDPKQACTAIGLCSSRDDRISERQIDFKLPSDSPACELCELLVQTVDQYLKSNKTEAAINATIYKLCNDLPAGTLQSTCLQYAPDIVAVLSKGVDPKLACTALQLCTSTGIQISTSKFKRETDDVECALCKLMIQALDRELGDNKSEAFINNTVHRLCNALPAVLRDTCVDFAPDLVSAMSKGVNPKEACTVIKACPSTDIKMSFRNIDAERLSDNPACELCELLVQAVDQYLKDNKTEAAINATVYKLCNDLPAGTLQSTCLQFAPEVVSILSKGVDPKQACTAIGLCTSKDVQVSVPRIKTVSDSPACELCELLVQTVDQYLKENKTEAAINATVYKLCNDLPAGTLQNTCLQYAPDIVSALSKGVDPKQACTALQLCASAENGSQRVRTVPGLSDTPVCELCELLVQTVDRYLKDNKTEAAINATVYKLCNDLPAGTPQSACLQYAPQIVSALSKGVDPKQACTFLQLCASKEAENLAILSNALLNPRAMVPESADDRWCTICKDHIGIIDEDLYRVEPAVQHLLDDICHRLPPPTDKACLKTADTTFPEIFENFLNGTGSAENICKLLELCTN